MKIPKVIHYCWFGGQPLSPLAIYCINSWKKFCPDYQIIRWDESNTDLNTCQFVREAFELQKWAFVSDYIRLKVIEEFGGIYLDIDVELLTNLDSFLFHDGFMSFEYDRTHCKIATGLGFGSIPHHPIIKELLNNYENRSFIKLDKTLDTEPCPQRDTKVLVKLGLIENGLKQSINGFIFYPSDYFCPISFYGERNFTKNTVSIHHFNASWLSEDIQNDIERKKKLISLFGYHLGRCVNIIFRVKDYLLKNR
ncbi:glycosyltransferase family 32 protein [Providencia hangzhouensis]|uniref:glycosyltransferase family 32 protein n=2 Tax=Providencia hangzhouensis TaxID=3031799 RepID=UPI0024AAF4E6|nr:glycosyl transferase [Providencia rettgeri]